MVEDFEEKIEEIEIENMEIISDMDTLSKKFIEETKSFIKYYIDASVSVTVKSQYDLTNNLNIDQLGDLKERRNSLNNIIASKIDEEFKNPTYWTHAHEIPDHANNQELGYDNHNNKFLKLKEIINSFDNCPKELITQYGYTNNNYPDIPTLSNWPEPMISTIHKYSSLNKRLLQLKRELITAHREKSEYEAQKLWDKL